jgi:hypothetical protein
VTLISPMNLSDEDKLETLRKLDQFRQWRSLDDKRYCLVCGKIVTGRQIVAIGGTRGTGPLGLKCPTQGCNSISMDWVLPTGEVLANLAMQQAVHRDSPAPRSGDVRKNLIASRLRKLATDSRDRIKSFMPGVA